MLEYLKPSREMILDAINIENGLQNNPLTFNQIALGIAQEITTPGSTRNTRLLVYGLRGGGYRGNVTLQYNRLSVENMFRGVTVLVLGDPVAKLSDILPAFNKAYGITLVASDIEDQDVSALGESWVSTIAIKAGNPVYKGSFQVRYAKNIPRLINIILDNTLEVIAAPYTDRSKPHAEYLAYGYDWTEMQDTFDKNWSAGVAVTQLGVDQLNEVVPLKFTFGDPALVSPGEVSLRGAKVVSRQAVTAGSVFNQSYQKVVVVQLAADSNYAGQLYLHYLPVE